MSQHEGVSCDCCNKNNFRGKRYKCLVCFDYDLCSTCFDAGVTTTRHQVTHPMQCIITRSDFELFYGGETIQFDNASSYSYVCPHCGKLGLTESQLYDHVVADHSNDSNEVICPVCAVIPVGHPNHMTDDLGGHLNVEHRPGVNRELEEPLGRNIRRMFHPVRNIPPPRSRRAAQQVASSITSTTPINLSGVTSSARENFDPIAELLTQLSGVRRAAQQQSVATTASQLQVLQQQLQFERLQVQQARERLERLPRKQPAPSATTTTVTVNSNNAKKVENTNHEESKFLLNQYYAETSKKEDTKKMIDQRKQRELFTKEMLYSLLSSETSSHSPCDEITKPVEGESPPSKKPIDHSPPPADGNDVNKQFLELSVNDDVEHLAFSINNKITCCSGATPSTATTAAENNHSTADVTQSLRKQFSNDLLNPLEDSNGSRSSLS